MTTTSKVLAGVVAGAAAGAALGILFAPHKGSKTRKLLMNRGSLLAADLQEKITESKDTLNELKKGITQAVMDKVEQYSFSGPNGAK